MIDRLFTAMLAFTLLAGGTAAVGSAMFGTDSARQAVASAAQPTTRLPTVELTVKRAATDVAQGDAATRVQ